MINNDVRNSGRLYIRPEFPTIFTLHNDIFKFSNFENRFLKAEFHNEPARYLGYTRDQREHDRSAFTVPAPILACFLFAYVPGVNIILKIYK